MDAKTEIGKMWKDLQDSAREFAHHGLQFSTKALDAAAQRLRELEAKLAPEPPKTTETTESPSAPSNGGGAQKQ